MAQIKGKQLADASIAFGKLDAAAIITQTAGGITASNSNDTTIATSSAVKNYVDAQAAGMSGFSIQDTATTPNTQAIADGDTITFAGTANEVEVTVSSTDTVTIGLPNDVTIAGNLTVNGQMTTIDSETVKVEDKDIELGVVATPTDSTANGGGIILKGASDKTFKWIAGTNGGSWTSSEHIDLLTGMFFSIAGNKVIDIDGAVKVQSGVASNGLSHNSGALSSKGLTVESFEVDATITSGNAITANSTAINVSSVAVGEIELKVNGIVYRQGINTSGSENDWYLATNSDIVWHGDFDLDNTDVVTLTYHTI